MDNQQGKNDCDLHWLGGFIDGEGSFLFHRQRNPASPKGHTWRPAFRLSNTDWPTLPIVTAILEANGLAAYVFEKRRQPPYKDVWSILIYGPKRMKRFSEKILPYLRTKRCEGEIMLEYCNARLARPYERNANGRTCPPPYSEYELGLIESLRPIDSPHRLNAGRRRQEAPDGIVGPLVKTSG